MLVLLTTSAFSCIFSRLLLMCVNECPNFYSLHTLKATIISQLKKHGVLKSCKLWVMAVFCPPRKAVATTLFSSLVWIGRALHSSCMAPRMRGKPLHGEGAIWGQIKLFSSGCHNCCGWAVPNQDWERYPIDLKSGVWSPCSRIESVIEVVGPNYRWRNWKIEEVF